MIRPFIKYRFLSAVWFSLLQAGALAFFFITTASEVLIYAGAVITGLFIAHWLVVFMDILVQQEKNKLWWILGMLFLPIIAMVAYLYTRKISIFQTIKKVV